MLKYNSTLSVLFMSWNKIKHKGATDLANALAVNVGI